MYLNFSVQEIKQIIADHCNNLNIGFDQQKATPVITADLVTIKMIVGRFDEGDEFDGITVNIGEAIARRDNL